MHYAIATVTMPLLARVLSYHSYMLYSISRPDKYGCPMVDLSSDAGQQLSMQEKKSVPSAEAGLFEL